MRLLDVIADSQGLQVLCGDIGNAFIQANTKEKVYTHVGKEFGEHVGKIALIIKVLYRLTTSAERLSSLLADFSENVVSIQLNLIKTSGCDSVMVNGDTITSAHMSMTSNVLQKILECGLIVSLPHSLLRNQAHDLIILVMITHTMLSMICGLIPQKLIIPRTP